MPGNYDGRPGQITFPTALTVVGCIAGNPTTIVVSGALPAEFFLSGYGGLPAAPRVTIQGIVGIAGANGTFLATPTGASVFTIPVNTTGQGPYVSGGTVNPLYVQSLYTLPVDGDSDNSASIAAWGQATGDRTQFLAGELGFMKIAGRVVLQHGFGPGLAWAHIAGASIGAGTWGSMISDGGLSAIAGETGGIVAQYTAPATATMIVGVGGIQQGTDLVEVSLECNVANLSSASGYLGLWYAFATWGASVPAFGAMTQLQGATRYPSGSPGSMTLRGWLPHLGSGVLYLAPAVYSVAGGSFTTQLVDDALLTVTCHRLTGMLE